jgi:hypothetical protein
VDDDSRIDTCRAAQTHLFSFLGWLRACESFGIKWQDLTIIEPPFGPSMGLLFNLGVILVKLLAQMKSSQAATADIVLAYTICRHQAYHWDFGYVFWKLYSRSMKPAQILLFCHSAMEGLGPPIRFFLPPTLRILQKRRSPILR